jgi:hypothetical protein
MREIATTPAQNQPPDKGLDVLSAFIRVHRRPNILRGDRPLNKRRRNAHVDTETLCTSPSAASPAPGVSSGPESVAWVAEVRANLAYAYFLMG